MAYKVFSAPTGSGNTVFEGDVLNGYATPVAQRIVLKFYSNDRGYCCASFGSDAPLDLPRVRALRDELAALLDSSGATAGVFSAKSGQKTYALGREIDGGPLVLSVFGSDPRFGTSYHRGDLETIKKIVGEFDTVLKSLDELAAGKSNAA